MSGPTALFATVLNMSITASYVAIGVMMIRLGLRRAPRVYSYALWSAVLIRMLVPVSFAAAISLLGFLRFGGGQADPTRLIYVPQAIGLAERPAVATGIAPLDTLVNGSLPGADATASANPMQLLLDGASVIWLAGVAVLLAHGVYSYVRIAGRVRTATRLRDNVYESDRIPAPFVFGLRKPRIYVPVGLGAAELGYIVAHEETHIRRRDYLLKPLAYVAVAVHWFNPLLWASYLLMSKDMEMACDERVMKSLDSEESKAGYSRTLLSLATGDRGWLRGQPIGFGDHHVSSRIKNILRYRKPAPYAIVAALLLVAVLVVGFTANPLRQNGEKEKPSNDTVGQEAVATDYDVRALYESRTPYVGDNGKVGRLVNLMPLPEGLKRDHISLQTTDEPYGLTVHYRTDPETGVVWNVDKGDPHGYAELFQRNGAVLMSLIGNVGYIDFAIDDQNVNYRFNRSDAEVIFGGDVAPYSENEELLAGYIERVEKLGMVSAAAPRTDADNVYVLSHSEIRTKQGETLYVNLEMTDGKHYTEEEAGGPGGGIYPDNYSGTYRLRVADGEGKTVSTFSALGGQLNFGGAFELAWADYNGDGQPDFTLGQWGGSNGDVYALYTLNAQNVIEKLKLDREELYIADHRPSIILEQPDKTSFAKKAYDQISGDYVQQEFRWDGQMFREEQPS